MLPRCLKKALSHSPCQYEAGTPSQCQRVRCPSSWKKLWSQHGPSVTREGWPPAGTEKETRRGPNQPHRPGRSVVDSLRAVHEFSFRKNGWMKLDQFGNWGVSKFDIRPKIERRSDDRPQKNGGQLLTRPHQPRRPVASWNVLRWFSYALFTLREFIFWNEDWI